MSTECFGRFECNNIMCENLCTKKYECFKNSPKKEYKQSKQKEYNGSGKHSVIECNLYKTNININEFNIAMDRLIETIYNAFKPIIDSLSEAAEQIFNNPEFLKKLKESYECGKHTTVVDEFSNMSFPIIRGDELDDPKGLCPICNTEYPKKFADTLVDNPTRCFICKGLERCECSGILVKRKKKPGSPIIKICDDCGKEYE